MNYTSNWNKLSGDKFPYIRNLTTFLPLVKISLEISPIKLVVYHLRFSQITVPLLHTYTCILSLMENGNSEFR